MPYTISHVAVVLPFSRLLARARVLSAVVIGSMVPDFGYLSPIHLARPVTHSIVGLVSFCLPVGLLVYWVFQRLMKTPLMSLLPDQAYMRWRPFSAPAALDSPRQWILAAAGVLAGAVTHLVWDDFTHKGARGLRMIPELDDWLFELHGHQMMGAHLLEIGSSVVGLAIVIAGTAFALRGGRPQSVTPRVLTAAERRTWVVGYVMGTVGITLGFTALHHADAAYLDTVGSQTGNVAVAFLRAVVLAAVGVSLLLNRQLHRRAQAGARLGAGPR